MATPRSPEKLINICLDLETVSTERNAGILQIGAMIPAFDQRDYGHQIAGTFDVTIRYDSVLARIKAGIVHMSEETMDWWDVPKRAQTRKEVFSGQVDYPDAMGAFKLWIEHIKEVTGKEVAVWGNGSDFDNVVLAHSLGACGYNNVWKYYNNRDLRTLRALFPVDIKSIPNINPHTALSDAAHEAAIMDRIVNTYFQAERTLRYGLS